MPFLDPISSFNKSSDQCHSFSCLTFLNRQQKDKKTGKPKIWLYRNKETGESKGEATITYDDANAAQSAISWFDSKDFNGVSIHVSLAQRQNTWQKGGGGFRGGNRGGGGGGNRDGGRGGGFNRDGKHFKMTHSTFLQRIPACRNRKIL